MSLLLLRSLAMQIGDPQDEIFYPILTLTMDLYFQKYIMSLSTSYHSAAKNYQTNMDKVIFMVLMKGVDKHCLLDTLITVLVNKDKYLQSHRFCTCDPSLLSTPFKCELVAMWLRLCLLFGPVRVDMLVGVFFRLNKARVHENCHNIIAIIGQWEQSVTIEH